MRQIFYVDRTRCGGEELPGDFELEDFWEVLQGKLSGVEVIAFPETGERAVNRNLSLVPERCSPRRSGNTVTANAATGNRP